MVFYHAKTNSINAKEAKVLDFGVNTHLCKEDEVILVHTDLTAMRSIIEKNNIKIIGEITRG